MRLVQSKRFPDQAPNAVARHSGWNQFFWNDQCEPGAVKPIAAPVKRQVGSAHGLARSQRRGDINGTEALESTQPQTRSNAQASAAFGTTRTNHRASSPGTHADEKAVRALATDYGGLVSALHV